MEIQDNEETLNINIDDLFKDPVAEEPEVLETVENHNTPETKANEPTEQTKAVSERINEVRRKTESETQEKIARELGYENYADMRKAKEKKLLEDAGLDEDDIKEVVEKLVAQRLADDPRMKKLEEIEAKDKATFVNSQLKEINTLTGTNFTSIEQLPKDTLDLWAKTGNLKQAYLATQGEAIILKNNAAAKNTSSLAHLASAGSNSNTHTKSRLLNEEEKAIWRSVMPDITDDELSKKTVDIE